MSAVLERTDLSRLMVELADASDSFHVGMSQCVPDDEWARREARDDAARAELKTWLLEQGVDARLLARCGWIL